MDEGEHLWLGVDVQQLRMSVCVASHSIRSLAVSSSH